MLSWLRQKYAARHIRRAELRAAKKAADAAIKANPLLYKRAVRLHDKTLLRRWTLRAAFAVAVTGITTVEPDLVSAPLDQHAAAHGVQGGLQKHFSTQNIRVYHRSNPLVPFHLAGQMARISWQESDSVIGRAIGVPFNYASGLFSGFGSILFSSPLDAYSLSDNQPPATRQCFIRPPGHIDSGTLLSTFTGLGDVRADDENNAAVIRYYYTLVMAHEARHCDQDKKLHSSTLNEIDADLVADRLTTGILSEEDRRIRRDLWAALRLTGAVVGNDVGHYSTPSLIRGGVTPLQAIDDAAVVRRLVLVLQDAETRNKDAFPASMSRIERRYHLAKAMLADAGAGDAQLRAKASLFISAVDYLNGIMANQVAATPHAQMASRIDMSWLTRNYNPAPLPVGVPASSPRAGS